MAKYGFWIDHKNWRKDCPLWEGTNNDLLVLVYHKSRDCPKTYYFWALWPVGPVIVFLFGLSFSKIKVCASPLSLETVPLPWSPVLPYTLLTTANRMYFFWSDHDPWYPPIRLLKASPRTIILVSVITKTARQIDVDVSTHYPIFSFEPMLCTLYL